MTIVSFPQLLSMKKDLGMRPGNEARNEAM